MTSQKLGLLIGSVFGLVFVEVNSGALPTALGIGCRVVGGIAFLLVLVGIRRQPSHSEVGGATEVGRAEVGRAEVGRAEVGQPSGIGFTAGYWVVVAGELIAIVVGVRLLAGPLDAPDAGVAWVALVVGLHFVALAVVWAQRSFAWLGGSLALCGVAGLVLGSSDAPKAVIAGVGGVLPGALLLGFALHAVLRPTQPARDHPGPSDAVGGPE